MANWQREMEAEVVHSLDEDSEFVGREEAVTKVEFPHVRYNLAYEIIRDAHGRYWMDERQGLIKNSRKGSRKEIEIVDKKTPNTIVNT